MCAKTIRTLSINGTAAIAIRHAADAAGAADDDDVTG